MTSDAISISFLVFLAAVFFAIFIVFVRAFRKKDGGDATELISSLLAGVEKSFTGSVHFASLAGAVLLIAAFMIIVPVAVAYRSFITVRVQGVFFTIFAVFMGLVFFGFCYLWRSVWK
jgi:NADH:ubiquinone oxidoreductase subunit 3 (subunit A)